MRSLSTVGKLLCLGLIVVLAPKCRGQLQGAAGDTIPVPLAYENPAMGKAPLTFEFGAPFDRSKPVVLVIADGQQFSVRHGAMKALQESTFGNSFNVVGIITRGTTPDFIKASLNQDGNPNWLKAWQIFNSNEWIEDIESVRKVLVGDSGTVDLYGRSGGAYLVHQYLAKHGEHVARAFTQSAVNPSISRERVLVWTATGVNWESRIPSYRQNC